MKAVTLQLEEPVYREYQKMAHQSKRSASDLIQEAMESYRSTFAKKQASLADASPAISVQRVLRPWVGREDLLEDFCERQ